MNRRSWRSRLWQRRRSPPSDRHRYRPHRSRPARAATRGALQPDAPWPQDRYGAELATLEQALATLRKRYDYGQLQARQGEIEAQTDPSPADVAELQALRQRLEQLEADLAAEQLHWGVWVEPFWQAVRFGGLGIVIGWILRAIAQGQ